MKRKVYEAELAKLEIELVKLQGWIKYKGLKIAVLFEGRDSAGKGGVVAGSSVLGMIIPPFWDILVKFVTPAILVYLLYLSLAGDLAENYSGYPTEQLILYGVGWMFICLVVALGLTFIPWKPEKLKRRHLPEEDELLI